MIKFLWHLKRNGTLIASYTKNIEWKLASDIRIILGAFDKASIGNYNVTLCTILCNVRMGSRGIQNHCKRWLGVSTLVSFPTSKVLDIRGNDNLLRKP